MASHISINFSAPDVFVNITILFQVLRICGDPFHDSFRLRPENSEAAVNVGEDVLPDIDRCQGCALG